MRRLALVAVTGLVACLLPAEAAAWDSYCEVSEGVECPEGSIRATLSWSTATDPVKDEHRFIYTQSLFAANVPDEFSLRDSFLYYWTANPGVIVPAPFDVPGFMHLERRHIGEFADLPDFGYSLTDWVDAFRHCPPKPDQDPDQCHTFMLHMGAFNSSHFLPQAQKFYAHYHRLALAKADECKRMWARLGDRVEEFPEFPQECTAEALILEAIGQHYQQDAWSSGHMWERWGTPDFSGFDGMSSTSRLAGALVVAAVSGLIHGSEGLLTLPDPLCYPTPLVDFVGAGLPRTPAAGDLHYREVATQTLYAKQVNALKECSLAGVLEVFRATGSRDSKGNAPPPAPPPMPFDPTSDHCFSQRAVNEAMLLGSLELNVSSAEGFELVVLSAFPGADELQEAMGPLRYDLPALQRRLLVARISLPPDGTELATGGLGPFMGVQPNGNYTTLPDWVDPPLPWRVDPWSASVERDVMLTRVFHRGHAEDWCRGLSTSDLERLRQATHRGNSDERMARRHLCVEFARRHVAASTTDEANGQCRPAPASFCELIAGSGVATLEVPGFSGSPKELAAVWCDDEPEPTLPKCRDSRRVPKSPASAGVSGGDPHLRTFDGLAYDFQVAGEVVLVRSPTRDLEIQTRQRGYDAGACGGVAVNTAVAMRAGDHRVMLDVEGAVWLDGAPQTMASGSSLPVGDAILERREASHWLMRWPDGSWARVTRPVLEPIFLPVFDVHVVLAAARAGAVEGLLGNWDGKVENDLRLPGAAGASILAAGAAGAGPHEVDQAALYGRFADAWRVDAKTSLFQYGAGQSPETFHDRAFPAAPAALDAVAAETRAKAMETCAAVTSNPTLQASCAMDVACAGDFGVADRAAVERMLVEGYRTIPAPLASVKVKGAPPVVGPGTPPPPPPMLPPPEKVGACYVSCFGPADCQPQGANLGACAGFYCDVASSTKCAKDADCGAPRPLCVGSRCVQCRDDAGCGGAPCRNGRCGCNSNADCPRVGGLNYCGKDGFCGCATDADCPGGATHQPICSTGVH